MCLFSNSFCVGRRFQPTAARGEFLSRKRSTEPRKYQFFRIVVPIRAYQRLSPSLADGVLASDRVVRIIQDITEEGSEQALMRSLNHFGGP